MIPLQDSLTPMMLTEARTPPGQVAFSPFSRSSTLIGLGHEGFPLESKKENKEIMIKEDKERQKRR